MFVDSGLASYLQAPGGAGQGGGPVENFVMSELARQLTWAQIPANLFHFRDREGREVDAVLEDNEGRVVGIEVKSAQTIRPDDLHGLRVDRGRRSGRSDRRLREQEATRLLLFSAPCRCMCEVRNGDGAA
jgi:hypothetical protein